VCIRKGLFSGMTAVVTGWGEFRCAEVDLVGRWGRVCVVWEGVEKWLSVTLNID
jgi:hypothetical protein